ncbi:MAG: triacylglycerol lipase [Myxococcota bacterium]|nr:triacylglycerol lipase [Myxococcota bacterium]
MHQIAATLRTLTADGFGQIRYRAQCEPLSMITQPKATMNPSFNFALICLSLAPFLVGCDHRSASQTDRVETMLDSTMGSTDTPVNKTDSALVRDAHVGFDVFVDTPSDSGLNDDGFESSDQTLDMETDVAEPKPIDAALLQPDAGSTCPPLDLDCSDVQLPAENAMTNYPIVFIHGMGGFEMLGPWDYFYGIPARLNAAGYPSYITVTDPFNSSEVRVQQLAPQLERILQCTCSEKLNLIAHSQGGIDARLFISSFDFGDRIASLTTMSTPHRGTPIADVLLGLSDGPVDGIVDGFVDAFSGIVWGQPNDDPNLNAAMQSCSVDSMVEFNQAHPNDPRIAYYSFAGFSGLLADGRPECNGSELPIPRRGDSIAPEFLTGFLYLGGALRANDGLVPVESARWGRFRGCVPADHLDQIGQLGGLVDTFNYQRFYMEHAEFLRGEGH